MTGSSSNHPAASRSNHVPETPLQKFDAALLRLKALFQLKKSKAPKIPFPPPSWFEDGKVVNPGASEAAAVPLPDSPPLEDAPNDGQGGGGEQDGDEAPPPPATWIARKIQEMIDAFPPGVLPSGSTSDPSPNKPSTPDQPADTPQQPPPVDSKLAQLLATAYIMNGSISRGRKSVWTALEKLGPPAHGLHRDGGGEEDDGDDRISLMICSPLIPDSKELPEIASCHMETVAVEEEEGEQNNTVQALKWPWPFSKWTGNNEGGSTPGDDKGKGKAPATPRKREVRVWEPSLTKLSIEVLWWGYRLYLPPPILAILSDKSMEASKRAALVTTALKWLVDHVPVKMLPPPLQPAVILLQTLIPFIGYIGAFIAWSFGAIKSFDQGHGVILTATWLLPVALIPGTWEAADLPKPAPEPTPTAPTGGPPTNTPADKAPPAPAPAPGQPPTSPVVVTPLPAQGPGEGPITSTPVVVQNNKKKKGRLV